MPHCFHFITQTGSLSCDDKVLESLAPTIPDPALFVMRHDFPALESRNAWNISLSGSAHLIGHKPFGDRLPRCALDLDIQVDQVAPTPQY